MLETIIVSKAIFELLILSALFPILWIHMILSDWFGWFPPGSIGAERIYKHKSLACPDASYPNQCCSVVDLKIFSLKVCYGGNSGMKFVSRVVISIHMLCYVVMCIYYYVIKNEVSHLQKMSFRCDMGVVYIAIPFGFSPLPVQRRGLTWWQGRFYIMKVQELVAKTT